MTFHSNQWCILMSSTFVLDFSLGRLRTVLRVTFIKTVLTPHCKLCIELFSLLPLRVHLEPYGTFNFRVIYRSLILIPQL